MFADPASSVGAMYAFEVQQPETAQTKVMGLREHYPVPEAAEEYFIVHANNHHESEKLLSLFNALSEKEQQQAIEACGKMSKALWDALEGIYEEEIEKP